MAHKDPAKNVASVQAWRKAHPEEYKRRGREWYQKHREAILAQRKQEVVEGGQVAERMRETARRSYTKHADRRRQEKRDHYASLTSDQVARHRSHGREWRAANQEKARESVRQSALRLRLKVLGHYSGGHMKCACCAESALEFLALDHIYGGGGRERRALGGGGRQFRHLVAQGFPPGYQVLCHNCNLARGFYGTCPHESETVLTLVGRGC
jgi:hypothetical protein